MRSARERRRVWRAAKRAAEEARDGGGVGETQRRVEEAEESKQSNEATLHLELHYPSAINPTTAAAATTATTGV